MRLKKNTKFTISLSQLFAPIVQNTQIHETVISKPLWAKPRNVGQFQEYQWQTSAKSYKENRTTCVKWSDSLAIVRAGDHCHHECQFSAVYRLLVYCISLHGQVSSLPCSRDLRLQRATAMQIYISHHRGGHVHCRRRRFG